MKNTHRFIHFLLVFSFVSPAGVMAKDSATCTTCLKQPGVLKSSSGMQEILSVVKKKKAEKDCKEILKDEESLMLVQKLNELNSKYFMGEITLQDLEDAQKALEQELGVAEADGELDEERVKEVRAYIDRIGEIHQTAYVYPLGLERAHAEALGKEAPKLSKEQEDKIIEMAKNAGIELSRPQVTEYIDNIRKEVQPEFNYVTKKGAQYSPQHGWDLNDIPYETFRKDPNLFVAASRFIPPEIVTEIIDPNRKSAVDFNGSVYLPPNARMKNIRTMTSAEYKMAVDKQISNFKKSHESFLKNSGKATGVFQQYAAAQGGYKSAGDVGKDGAYEMMKMSKNVLYETLGTSVELQRELYDTMQMALEKDKANIKLGQDKMNMVVKTWDACKEDNPKAAERYYSPMQSAVGGSAKRLGGVAQLTGCMLFNNVFVDIGLTVGTLGAGAYFTGAKFAAHAAKLGSLGKVLQTKKAAHIAKISRVTGLALPTGLLALGSGLGAVAAAANDQGTLWCNLKDQVAERTRGTIKMMPLMSALPVFSAVVPGAIASSSTAAVLNTTRAGALAVKGTVGLAKYGPHVYFMGHMAQSGYHNASHALHMFKKSAEAEASGDQELASNFAAQAWQSAADGGIDVGFVASGLYGMRRTNATTKPFEELTDFKSPEVKGQDVGQYRVQYKEIMDGHPKKAHWQLAEFIKILEKDGYKEAQIKETFKTYEQVLNPLKNGNDAGSIGIMTEFIRTQRKSGVPDAVIMEKLQRATRECA